MWGNSKSKRDKCSKKFLRVEWAPTYKWVRRGGGEEAGAQ